MRVAKTIAQIIFYSIFLEKIIKLKESSAAVYLVMKNTNHDFIYLVNL